MSEFKSSRPAGGEDRDDEPSPIPTEDPRVVQAAQEYLRELEQGRRPDRRQWLAQYPELAAALNECLDGLELMHGAAASVGHKAAESGAPGSDLQETSPLGDFRILREIGRGGMGIVYEAVQLSLGRRVALKVLPFAAGFDTRYLQRFRQEAQAAAQMHHTNIVPVFAVGCERGTHFYAMQLIEGHSLDTLIRQLRGDEGSPASNPGTASSQTERLASSRAVDMPATEVFSSLVLAGRSREGESQRTAQEKQETLSRLSAGFSTQRAGGKSAFFRTAAHLMAQAADALEYAHQQGVIHRDIKPGNLLIDLRQNLWITDFGLAHLHSQQSLTQSGDMLGTIRYASPEQVSGQRVLLDHRTDVYSLGATFYELVTLWPLFAGPTRESLLHQVLNQEPASPRSHDRAIPVELETILLKALNKNPADRYASAEALADDLRRFLQNEPIRARRPTLTHRARKWTRRHPALVAAAVLTMFITLVISGVSNWLITEANIRTKSALGREQLRAEEAEKRYVQARQVVDLLIDISETELADKPFLAGLRKRLLGTALLYYQDFISQHAGSPASQAELISVQERVRKILDDLTVLEGAGHLMLLGEPDVAADLQLSEAQRVEIGAILDRFSAQRRGFLLGLQQAQPEDRRSAFLELTREYEQAMRGVLSAEQLQRLGQIIAQVKGSGTFSDPDVTERLQLTDAQRQAIRQIEFEAMMAMWDRSPPRPPPFFGKGGPGGRGWPGRRGTGLAGPGGEPFDTGPQPKEDADSAPGEPSGPSADEHFEPPPPPDLGRGGDHGGDGRRMQQAVMEKILETLTPEQQAEWKTLTGEPFEGRVRPPFPGLP
ncbi:MAG: protein kinase domain-containing protein [Planctomycetota bacterium]